MFKQFLKNFFKNKTNRIFVLLVLSAMLLPTTYSRYITTESSNAVSSLAKWDVRYIEGGSNSVNLIALNNSSANYLFSIRSLSEVACDYSITISNVPNNVSLTVDGKSTVYTPVSGTITVPNIGSFEIDSLNDTNNHTLTFSTNSSTVALNTNLNLNVQILQRIGSGS